MVSDGYGIFGRNQDAPSSFLGTEGTSNNSRRVQTRGHRYRIGDTAPRVPQCIPYTPVSWLAANVHRQRTGIANY